MFLFIKLSFIEVCFPHLNAGTESNAFTYLFGFWRIFTQYYFMCQAAGT